MFPENFSLFVFHSRRKLFINVLAGWVLTIQSELFLHTCFFSINDRKGILGNLAIPAARKSTLLFFTYF